MRLPEKIEQIGRGTATMNKTEAKVIFLRERWRKATEHREIGALSPVSADRHVWTI